MTNIKMLFDICSELQSTKSKNTKVEILEREANNEEFKQFLKYVYDTDLVYGIQDKKLSKFVDATSSTETIPSFDSLFDTFEYLKINNTGSDNVVKQVAQFINNIDKHYKEFVIKSICKKLTLGITKNTISKVYKGLIEEFKVQKAYSYVDYKDKIAGEQYVLTEKKNGIRNIARVEANHVIDKSRQNKVVTGLIEIDNELAQLPDGIYDGELVIKNDDKLKHRQVLQKTMEIVNSDDANKTNLTYWIFDIISIQDFEKGESELTYFQRRLKHKELFNGFKHVKWIPIIYQGNDLSIVNKLMEQYDKEGKEGLMLNLDVTYKCKKHWGILKVKPVYTSDLLVTGFKLGKPTGKYKNTLGTITVDYKGYELGISGMPDSVRDDVWNNQDKYLGKILEVEHQQETTNKDGGLSLEYAQFERWRFDKDEPSYAHE